MSRNRVTIQFEGFDEIAERLVRTQGKLEDATEKALVESQKLVANKLQTDMPKHHRTGRTETTITDDGVVDWEGGRNAGKASIKVGFKISDGGLASIFLMYGTPRMRPDKKLYRDIYGPATKRELSAIQQEIFKDALRELEG